MLGIFFGLQVRNIDRRHVLGVRPAVGFQREIVRHLVLGGDITLSHERLDICTGDIFVLETAAGATSIDNINYICSSPR